MNAWIGALSVVVQWLTVTSGGFAVGYFLMSQWGYSIYWLMGCGFLGFSLGLMRALQQMAAMERRNRKRGGPESP